MRSQFASKLYGLVTVKPPNYRRKTMSLMASTTNEEVNDRFLHLLTQLYRVGYPCTLSTSLDSTHLQAHRNHSIPLPPGHLPAVSRHTDGFSLSFVPFAFIVFVVLTAFAHLPKKSTTIWRKRMPAQFHFRSPILSTLLLYVLIRILESIDSVMEI